jgi:hypothetical protein
VSSDSSHSAVLSLCIFGVVALGPSGVPGFIYYRF